ncbi:MAG TPA: hypothetical protein ENG42_00665, partial [Candidatus Aenigmarchaeota archaeon]|nr:hypothetical protein [Candidatus Aenigmarchaeota archaeon]
MIDIVEILAELLRVSPSIVQQYSAKGPIEALFFIFFLPTIFLLTAFYLFFSDFINHKGVNLLLSIAVYMFIIIQGYYSIIV